MGMKIAPNARWASRVTAHAPAADTAAVVTLAAETGKRHVISQVDVSYKGSITVAGLTITGLEGDDYALDLYVAEGQYQFRFDPPLMGEEGAAVVVTVLDPANAGGTAKVNVVHAR